MRLVALQSRRSFHESLAWAKSQSGCAPKVIKPCLIHVRAQSTSKASSPKREGSTVFSSWPSATWLGSGYSKQAANSILSQLPQLDYPKCSSLSTAVFLVTPAFAELFNSNNTFHKDAINKIYGNFKADHPPSSFVAIVDAVPTSKAALDAQVPRPLYEGVSICIFPDLFTEAEDVSCALIPHIRFYKDFSSIRGKLSTNLSYKLPVANTLFLNGHESTIFRQSWISGEPKSTVESNSIAWRKFDESTQHIKKLELPFRVLGDMTYKALSFYSNLWPLTSPKRICSHMGNVIRNVELEDGSIQPASSELEKVIPAYVKEKSLEQSNGNLRVYGLVMNPKLGKWDALSTPSNFENPAARNGIIEKAIRNGATLHRVTSGGGGWGNKQGLLSLEPATELTHSKDDSFEMPSFDFDADTVQPMETKSLFPNDSMIQFFAYFQPPPVSGNLTEIENDGYDVSSWSSSDWTSRTVGNPPYQKTVLGTTLGKDSGDIMSQPSGPNLGSSSVLTNEDAKPVMYPHLFGMITNGPISFSSSIVAHNHDSGQSFVVEERQTLIDVPDAFFENQTPDLANDVSQKQTITTNTNGKPKDRTSTEGRVSKRVNLKQKHSAANQKPVQ